MSENKCLIFKFKMRIFLKTGDTNMGLFVNLLSPVNHQMISIEWDENQQTKKSK